MSAGDGASPRDEEAAAPSIASAESAAIDDPPAISATEAATTMPRADRPLARLARAVTDVAEIFAPLDAEASSRVALLIRFATHLAAAAFAVVVVVTTIRPLTSPRPPRPLPGEGTEGSRFGLTLERRHAIFTQLAATEAYSRRMGTQGFPNDIWSAEDHRCAYERDAVRGTAARNAIDLSTAYLIFDEGIRSHWPGPDGKPLVATTIPLVPRRW